MIASDFFIEIADFETDRHAIAAVRGPVFEQEQAVPSDIVWDDRDPLCRHVLARALDGTPVGCGRLTPDQRIGRMAVLPDWRGRGVGTSLLNTLIDCAHQRGATEIELQSQVEAIPFYQRMGFVGEGEVYEVAGIPHKRMRLSLAERPPLIRSEPPRGAESAEIEFSSLEKARELALTLLKLANRQLWIYTRDLDAELFKGERFVDQLRRIATTGRGAEICILVQDIEAAQKHGGSLLSLTQRLSSTVHIRQPGDEVELQFAGAYLLNDRGGLMTRPLASRYEGCAREHAPGQHRQLLEQFRHAWERARPASELRAQSL